MERPSESLKSYLNRFAQLIRSESGGHMLYLLRLCGFFDAPLNNGAGPASIDSAHDHTSGKSVVSAQRAADRVGIWERRTDNGRTCFVRSQDMVAEYHRWSTLGRIEPKSSRLRVVLIGESVARGYLYDPQFNPAMVLQEILQSQLGPDGVEVLDLARTGVGLEIRELALSARLLDPDVVIIFSGNNWTVSPTQALSHLRQIDLAIRESGVPGLKSVLQDYLERQIKDLMDDVAAAYAEKNIPLIWIVPEFNLDDWRDPVANAAFLAGERNQEWIAARERAETALRHGNFRTASENGHRLVALDEGTTAAGFYVLAECSLQAGNLQEARRYLELARDASIWVLTFCPPRAYSVTQRALRAQAAKNNNGVVDLPALFREHLNGGIPGRQLFLDYCHMTEEGIRVAMAGVAATILHTLYGTDVDWSGLAGEASSPGAEVEADAAFLAAVHNAHLWQSPEIVRYHCRRAVHMNARIAEVMQYFIDLQSRRTPMLMCRSAERIAGIASQAVQSYLLGLNTQRLDPALVETILAILPEVKIDCKAHINQLRRQEHSVRKHEINLLDYYYCSASGQEKETTWALPDAVLDLRTTNYYKAYSPTSKFVFLADGNHSVQLDFTSRLSDWGPSEGTMLLGINGEVAFEAVLRHEWRTWEVVLPRDLVVEGLNEIEIRWPGPLFPGLEPLAKAADDLVHGFAPEFFYIFGEIHTFVASLPAGADGALSSKCQSALRPQQLSQAGRI